MPKITPSNNHVPPSNTLRDVRQNLPSFSSIRTIGALMLREISTTNGRSFGGYAWAVLEPTLGILVLVAVFSTGFRNPPLGDNFAIFYASGLLPFLTFSTTAAKVQQSINYSRQLLSYPRVTFMDTIAARLILNVLTQSFVSLLLFTLILSIFDTRTTLDLPQLLNSYTMCITIGFGVGVLNCVLVSKQQFWQSIWSVLTRPLILLSGVIFLHDRIPEPYQSWLEWNPLVHPIGLSRKAFYYSYQGDYIAYAYPYVFGLTTSLLGILFLRSYTRDFLER